MSVPVSVAEIRQRARRAFERHAPKWAAEGAEEAALNVPLHPPSERAALTDLATTRQWVEDWREAEAHLPVRLEWANRSWARIGTQQVPVRVTVQGAEAIAHLADTTTSWQLLSERLATLRSLTGTGPEQIATLQSHARTVARLDESDFSRLLHVLEWLRINPASGRLVRELPIRGIDTKWIGRRRRLVEELHQAVTGRTELGLREPPALVRMRILDPAYSVGGLRDITAPVPDLAKLPFAPELVFVFENLSTLLAMPDTPGAVVLDGGGHRVNLVAAIPWASEVTYWGDLDSHGFAILHRLRRSGVRARSALMDRETLRDHHDLCVVDPTPNIGFFDELTAEERSTLNLLSSSGNLRLEQERIPWDYALARLA